MIGSRFQPSAANAVGSFLDYLNERIYIGDGTTVAYTALGGSPPRHFGANRTNRSLGRVKAVGVGALPTVVYSCFPSAIAFAVDSFANFGYNVSKKSRYVRVVGAVLPRWTYKEGLSLHGVS